MKVLEETILIRRFQSEACPEVDTTDSRLAEIIAWADKHPHVWDIVSKKRSKAFGLNSCVYIGWAQTSKSPEAVLERVRHFHDLVVRPKTSHPHSADSIFTWRAKFTLKHYRDKGFTGGFFQQHDARYRRSCLTLDYTPDTFDLVLGRFRDWMDPYYNTAFITVNGKTVWTAPHKCRHGKEN